MVRTRVFKDKMVLQKMLLLRQQGWPIKELGLIFNVEHTSIRKACLRSGLPAEVKLLPRPIILFKHVIIDYNGERINSGKTYKEYLDERKKRNIKPLKVRV